jgi:hypothetical protein
MTIANASLKEGSEETRQKRSVRRYLNKKKDRKDLDETVTVVDEGSEEARQKRAKRIEQKKKEKKEPLDEAVIPGTLNHMMHELHNYHLHGSESPHYHIHTLGRTYAPSGLGSDTHHYAVISKSGHHDDLGSRHHASSFRVWNQDGKTHVIHRGFIE